MKKYKATSVLVRTTLTPKAFELLKQLALQGIFGSSVPEIIRRFVDEGLQKRFFK
jgi:hypothetical protein